MSMEVQGAVILSAIAKSPEAFGMTTPQVNALAMNTILLRFKDKAVTLPIIKEIMQNIGAHDFTLAIDHLPNKDIAGLVKRLDPKNPELRSGDEAWQRRQIALLAAGKAEPASATPRPARSPRQAPTKSKAPKTGEVMKSKALKARAPRKSAAKDEL